MFPETRHFSAGVVHGQNKTLHQGSSLIAYSGLINYADSYQNWLSKQMPQTENKSKPSVGQFYDYYHAMLSQKKLQDDTVVFINCQSPWNKFRGL